MKKLILLAMGLMMMATGCSREVYINKHSEIIREKDTSSNVVVIDREKEVHQQDREVVREKRTSPRSRRPLPASDGEYQTVVD